MIETVVLRYLEGKLSAPVYMSQPEKPPRFVFLEKTASGRANQISRATFAIQSYGANLLDAMNLNKAAKDAMDNITELSEIASSRLNSDYPFPDEGRKRHRYQAVYDLTHY